MGEKGRSMTEMNCLCYLWPSQLLVEVKMSKSGNIRLCLCVLHRLSRVFHLKNQRISCCLKDCGMEMFPLCIPPTFC